MAIHRNCVCVCVELNKLKSALKFILALRRHPHVNIAGEVECGDCSHGLKSPNIAGTAPARKFLLQRYS